MTIDTNELKVGIPIIDNQHKRLVILINKLSTCNEKGAIDKQILNEYVNEIIYYSIKHFDEEEYLMKSEDYPLLEEHMKQHNLFRNKAEKILEEIENVKEEDIKKYVSDLSKWFVEWFKMQVVEEDIKLAEYLKNRI